MSNLGIYKIENLKNGKVYIGSSCRLKQRKHEHFKSLDENTHCNCYLQNAYNKYGKDNFKWEIVEYVDDVDKLLEKEQYWINEYLSTKRLYNLRSSAERRKISEFTKTKLGNFYNKEDWQPYYDMYLKGTSFYCLGNMLDICSKMVERQFKVFGFDIVKNKSNTSNGLVSRDDLEYWSKINDRYMSGGVSFRDLEKELKLNRHGIRKIFLDLKFPIKTKEETCSAKKLNVGRDKNINKLKDMGYCLLDEYIGISTPKEKKWIKYNLKCDKCGTVFVATFNGGIHTIKCPTCYS